MKKCIYMYRVTNGQFKGKTVQSFNPAPVFANLPHACFDSDGNEYIIGSADLFRIGDRAVDIPDDMLVEKPHDYGSLFW